MENEGADAGRDGRTRRARPDSKVRAGTREKTFSCSADHEQDWQPYRVVPYSAESADHTYVHTISYFHVRCVVNECHRYPFLLPNLVVGVVVLLSVPLVLFGLPETLDRNGGVRHKRISAR